MSSSAKLLAIFLLISTFIPFALCEEKDDAPIPFDKIQHILAEGVQHLYNLQDADGLWYYGSGTSKTYPLGATALALHALVLSGISPKEARFNKALNELFKLIDKLSVDQTTTYELGLGILCLESIDRRLQADRIMKLRKVLLDQQAKSGGWDYRKPAYTSSTKGSEQRTDWSNTQFAVLGLSGAERADTKSYVNRKRYAPDYWMKLRDYIVMTFISSDNGWPYCPVVQDIASLRATATMTCAGIASTLLCYSSLNGTANFPVGSDRTLLDLVDKGLSYFQKNPSQFIGGKAVTKINHGLTYRLYAAERVGFYTGLRKVGGIDWFREGVERLIDCAKDAEKGGWDDAPGTSLALLFLSKGRWPLIVQKLDWGKGWNDCPLDLLRLTEKASEVFERNELDTITSSATAYMPTPRAGKRSTWVTVGFNTPFEKWMEVPLLFFSGQKFPTFTDEQRAMLHRYAMCGGTIMADTVVGSSEFDKGFREFVATTFPGYELEPLKRDHQIYSSWFRGTALPLEGVNGPHGRLMILYSQKGMSADWENGHIDGKESRLGINILKYVADQVPGFWR